MVVLPTVCELLMVYVPAPPEPEPNDTIIVLAAIPVPWMVCPRYRVPDDTALTVNVVPEMLPVTTAPTVTDDKDWDNTVCEMLTVYVPVPPDPVPSAVMTVSFETPTPNTCCPTANAPVDTLLTVNVVPEMSPVNTAVASAEILQVYRYAPSTI